MWDFLQSIIDTNNFIKHIQTSYDPDQDLFTDPNVYSTEVVGWGTTSGLDHLDDKMASSTYYFHQVITALKNAGYKDGVDLFGAPYDFRLENFKSATADGGLFSNLKALIENIHSTTGDPVFFVSDGAAAGVLRHFLVHYVDADWKATNIAGWVSAGGGFGGAPVVFHYLISYKPAFIPTLNGQQMHQAEEYYAGLYWGLPQINTYPADYVLATVSTTTSNFTITVGNITEGFKRSIGDAGATAAQNFVDILNSDFDPPEVDLFYYYGTGNSTVASEVYSGGTDANWWQSDGKAVTVDGDGLIPVESATAPEQWVGTTQKVIQGTNIPGVDDQTIIANNVFLNGMVSIVTAGGWEANPMRPLFEIKQRWCTIFLEHAGALERGFRELMVSTVEKVKSEFKTLAQNRDARSSFMNKISQFRSIQKEGQKAVTSELAAFCKIYTSAESLFDTITHETATTSMSELEETLSKRTADVVARLDSQRELVVQAMRRVGEEILALLKE